MKISKRKNTLGATALCVLLTACSSSDDNDMTPANDVPADQVHAFALDFAATDSQSIVGCGDVIDNLGIGGQNALELTDLRFYISALELLDSNGEVIDYTLDDNEFQYSDDTGRVSLIDLTDNSTGACADESLSSVSGTDRINSQVTGMATSEDISSIRFSVGVPQALMKAMISENTAEGAPAPLNELYWSWASGYRHFLMNFLASHSNGSTGGGAVHIGSLGCTASDGENALETLDVCDFVNTPDVELTGVTADSVIAVDVTAAVADVDFLMNVLDSDTREPVLDENGAEVVTTGVSCHSGLAQPDCAPIFGNFGLSVTDGTADAAANSVFSLR